MDSLKGLIRFGCEGIFLLVIFVEIVIILAISDKLFPGNTALPIFFCLTLFLVSVFGRIIPGIGKQVKWYVPSGILLGQLNVLLSLFVSTRFREEMEKVERKD